MSRGVAAQALVALVLVGCGHYGPPRRPEPEPITPLVVVAPAPAAAEPDEPATPDEQCEAPSP